jgi:predicted transposase YbfD/YdcC
MLRMVPDPRNKRGIRHELLAILMIAIAATISGRRSFCGIGEYAQELPQPALRWIGCRFNVRKGRFIAPSEKAIRALIGKIGAETLDEISGRWMLSLLDSTIALRVAMDGKVLRGSLTTEGHVKLFAAMIHGTGVVVGQREIPAGTGENAQFTTMINSLGLSGVIYTADALHTHADNARAVLAGDNHYVFIVKGNQPTLFEDTQKNLAGKFPATAEYTYTERGHGRIVTRTIRATTVKDNRFPGAAQIFRIIRTVSDLSGQKISKEVVYGITSLTTKEATLTQLASIVQGHWGIENLIHYVRDVTYDEDRNQVHTQSGPQAMATFRNIALGLVRLTGFPKIATALRHLGANPLRALALLPN